MTKDAFRKWMSTMIKGIHSLAEHQLVIESSSGVRRGYNAKPFSKKEEELKKWPALWDNEDIQTLIDRAGISRPVRKKNFKYIVNNIRHSGRWWPLVSVIRSSASTSSFNGWLTIRHCFKPAPRSILRMDLANHKARMQRARNNRPESDAEGLPLSGAHSIGSQYQPIARRLGGCPPSVFWDGPCGSAVRI